MFKRLMIRKQSLWTITLGIQYIKYIDIDINCNARFKSSEVFSTAKDEGSGYECRRKTLGPLITTMSDYLAKH